MAEGPASVKEYFDTLEQRFRPAAAAGVTMAVQWEIEGKGGGDWWAEIADGALSLGGGRHAKPTLTISVGAEDYLKILRGELAGPMAVMTRKMKVAGNIMQARKMEELFPPGPLPEGAAKAGPAEAKAAAKKAPAKKAPAAKAPAASAAAKPAGKPLARKKGESAPPAAAQAVAAQAAPAGVAAARDHAPQVALVTGASGFIGSHVVKELLARGVRVKALVQPGVDLSNLEGLDVERVTGDLLDTRSLVRAVDGCDTVFHLAAIYAFWLPDPALMYRVNVEGTVRLMEACLEAGVGKVVHMSSYSTIGNRGGGEPSDETDVFNHWGTADHYVLSKYMGEREALLFNTRGLPVVVVNPCFPFGAHDVAPTPTGVLVQRFALGQSPVVLKGGINCVDVRDVAAGTVLAALRGRPGERYILGGTNMTYKEFGNLVCEIAGVAKPRFEVPVEPLARLGRVNEWISDHITHKPPVIVDKGLRFTGGRFLYADTTKAREELGYAPRPIEEAVEAAVTWFKYGGGAAS